MSKPKIKDIRRAYVLDIILRFEPEYENGIPQKRITKRVLIENINHKIKNKEIKKSDELDYKDQKDEIKRKVNIAVSKTINSLERDGIITVTSPRVPGKRGANPNIIHLNNTPEALYSILKCFDESVLGYDIEGSRFKFAFVYNLLVSEYYKSLVNIELVKRLTGLSELPFNEEDVELIYYLINSSPDTLKTLFNEVYETKHDFKLYSKFKSEKEKNKMIEFTKKVDKNRFIDSIQVKFVKSVFEYYNMPGFKGEVEAQINVKFKDEEGNVIYGFSNKSEADLEDSHVIYTSFNFI